MPKDAIMPPVHTDVVEISSGWASAVLYWIERLFVGAFWLAIILGLVRILFMGVLATIQYSRSGKEKKLLTAFTPGKVSIIVPAYNEEVNAIKTIENLLQQDYEDIEIVFVNDGSTDNTFEKVANAFLNNGKSKSIYTS